MLLRLIGYGYSMDFVLNGGNKIERRSALCKAYFSAPCGNCSCAVLGVSFLLFPSMATGTATMAAVGVMR